MNLSTWIGIGFSACCCVAFFLAIFAILTMILRPKRRVGDTLDGVAAAPARGEATRASLTRLEEAAPKMRRDIEPTMQVPRFPEPPKKPGR